MSLCVCLSTGLVYVRQCLDQMAEVAEQVRQHSSDFFSSMKSRRSQGTGELDVTVTPTDYCWCYCHLRHIRIRLNYTQGCWQALWGSFTHNPGKYMKTCQHNSPGSYSCNICYLRCYSNTRESQSYCQSKAPTVSTYLGEREKLTLMILTQRPWLLRYSSPVVRMHVPFFGSMLYLHNFFMCGVW